MEIVMTNEFGCLIAEESYDVDTADEAIKKFVNDEYISFSVGDVIQIRE